MVLIVGVLAAMPSGAWASITNEIKIQVEGNGYKGLATFTIPESARTAGGDYVWKAALGADGYTISDGATPLATIRQLECTVLADPSVDQFFDVENLTGVAQLFTITTSTVSFAALTNPSAYASTSMSVVDNNGDGGTAIGQYTGVKSYQAIYNTSNVWATLLDTVTAPAYASGAGSDRQPASGWGSITGSVNSITSEYKFLLSAEDSASGTSHFEVTPEPASLVLLASGVLAVAALRRRKAAR